VTATSVLVYFVLIGFALWSLLPIVWVAATSLRPDTGALAGDNPFAFSPELDNYNTVLTQKNFSSYFLNTLEVSVTATFLSLILGITAGYGLARFRFKGNAKLSQWILSTQLVPPIAFVVPFFIFFKTLQLLDTPYALIIVYTIFLLPFSIWLFTSFIKEVPVEAEEAALVDGCGRLRVLWAIILPTIWPAVGAVALLNLVAAWNEFVFALTLTSAKAATLPVAVSGFMGDRGILWGQITAAAVMTMIVPIIMSIIIHRYLVRGITLGAYK
jgi:multiple sugar transport system permease protein